MSEEMDVSVRNEENMDGEEGGGDEQEMTEEMRKKKEMMVQHFKEGIFGIVGVKRLEILEDFTAGKNPHISLDSVMAKIKDVEEKIKGGKVMEGEVQQEAIVQEAGADTGAPWSPEFAESSNWPILARNSRFRTTDKLGDGVKKKKRTLKSLDHLLQIGGGTEEKSPEQTRISESLKNLSKLPEAPTTPEFESPMREFMEDHSLSLERGQTPGDQAGVLIMDESKVQGMLDNYSQQATKTQEEIAKKLEAVLSSLSVQFQSQTQNIMERFEQTLNGALTRLTAREEVLVKKMDEKFEQITEQLVEKETKINALEEKVEHLATVNANLLSRTTALEDQSRRTQRKEDNYWINSVKIHGLRQARDSDVPRAFARRELDRYELAHLTEEAEHVFVGEDKKSLRLSFRNFTEFRKAFSELAAAGRRHRGSLRFNQLIPRRFGNKYERMREIGKEKVQKGEAVRFFFTIKDENLGVKVYRTHRSIPETIWWEKGEENPEEEERLFVQLGGAEEQRGEEKLNLEAQESRRGGDKRRRQNSQRSPLMSGSDPGGWRRGERYGGGREERRRCDLVPDRRGDGDRRGDAGRGEREGGRRREEQRRDESRAVRVRSDSDRSVRHFSLRDARNREPGQQRS